MNNTINLGNFNFKIVGHGHYNVTFTSAKTGKQWNRTINDMSLIDATKNAENPLKKDLNWLKKLVKNS